MIKFKVKNRLTDAVQFTAEIDCDDSDSWSLKLGLAVKWAIKAGADLYGANLRGADLYGAVLYGADLRGADLGGADLGGADLRRADLRAADLRGADLRGADLRAADLRGADLGGANLGGANLGGVIGLSGRVIDGGLRADGHRFLLTRTEPGPWRVKAGCRNFTIEEARKHWTETRGGTLLGEETFAIIDHMLRLAELREWPTG